MSYQINKKDVLFRQRLLKASGFDPQGLDGMWGKNTGAADDAFVAAGIALRDELGTFDARSEGNILGLHIKAQRLARKFLTKATIIPYVVRIISGTRTYAEQDDLYAKGRWGGPPGPKVTKAKGGQSNHNFAIAWDVALFRARPVYEWRCTTGWPRLPGSGRARAGRRARMGRGVEELSRSAALPAGEPVCENVRHTQTVRNG